MKISVTNQQTRLASFLPDFKARSLSYADPATLREKVTSLVVPCSHPIADLSRCHFDFLFYYQIFPSKILTFVAEWQPEQRVMQVGDIIVQQASLPPLAIAIHCIFAVRILDIFCSPTKVGFSYGTLQGHVESGVSVFYFLLDHGELRATIQTYSVPGLFISRWVASVLTQPYQQYCTNRALERMRNSFMVSNPQ